MYRATSSRPRVSNSDGGKKNKNKSKNIFRETKEKLDLRKSILKIFKCPFREEGTCKYEASPKNCMFAHPQTNVSGAAKQSTSNEITPSEVLYEVPGYVCVYNLLNACMNRNIFFRERVQSTYLNSKAKNSNHNSSISANSSSHIKDKFNYKFCSGGLHLGPEDMLDLEEFERENPSLIERCYGPDKNKECAVCYELPMMKRFSKNRLFAMLENCNHVFCASCISKWRSRSNNCPVCRVSSDKYVITAKWAETKEAKVKLFHGNQVKTLPLSEPSTTEFELALPLDFNDQIVNRPIDDYVDFFFHGDYDDDSSSSSHLSDILGRDQFDDYPFLMLGPDEPNFYDVMFEDEDFNNL